MKTPSILLLAAALCGLAGRASGQTLHTFEYFIDTDPGLGLATPVDVTTANTASLAYDLDLPPATVAALSEGLHRIGVRFKDDGGNWSSTSVQTFAYVPDPVHSLAAAEYFIDNDPGLGLASTVTLPAAPQEARDIDLPPATLAALSDGLHFIGVRYRDEAGQWSTAPVAVFSIATPEPVPDLTSFAWRITSAGGFDSGLQSTPAAPPGTTVSMNFDALVPGLVKDALHTITVQAVDSKGQASASSSLTTLVSSPDTDNDGLPDVWEITHFSNITTVNGNSDTDRDGVKEFGEYAFGLNPKNGDITGLPQPTTSDGLLTLSVSRQPFVTYVVETSTDLVDGSWSMNGLTTVTDLPATLTVRGTARDPRRFFRVRAVAAP